MLDKPTLRESVFYRLRRIEWISAVLGPYIVTPESRSWIRRSPWLLVVGMIRREDSIVICIILGSCSTLIVEELGCLLKPVDLIRVRVSIGALYPGKVGPFMHHCLA